MAEKPHGRYLRDATVTKEKLNLVDPVLGRDPVTKDYLEDQNYLGLITELEHVVKSGLGLLDQLKETTYPDLQPSWVNSNSFAVVTNGTGATTSATTKAISILSGNSGANASIKQYINISTFPNYEVGDEVKIRLLLLESVINTILPEVVDISMKSDSTQITPLTYETTSYAGNDQILEIIIPYTIRSKTETIEVTLAIKSSAPIQPSNTVITWNFFGIFNTADRYKDVVNRVSTDLKGLVSLYAFSERRPVISKVNITNSSDNSARLQDEFDEATQTSGEIIFPRNATILIRDTVDINGGIRIIGRGNTVFNPDMASTDAPAFLVKTSDSFIMEDFTFQRINGSSLATTVKFDSATTNTNSVFRNIIFLNVINGIYLDYADGIIIEDCVFGAGQTAINIGTASPSSIKNITIRRSTFNSVNTNNIFCRSANDLIISQNFFRNVAPSTTFAARPLVLSLDGNNTNTNVKIVENSFEAFREYGLRVATSGTTTLKKVLVSNNIFKDRSTTVPPLGGTHGVMLFTTSTPYAISNVIVENNDIETKLVALDFRGVDYLNVNNNIVKRDSATGPFPNAKVYNITDSPNQVRLGNIIEPGLTIS